VSVLPEAKTFQSRRLSLRYYDWGNADLPIMILVHGGRDHARSWDWTARELRDHYHVLAPDLVGHGESDWDKSGSYQIYEYTYDLAEFVRHLGAPRVRLIGHSLGGRIVLTFAGIFPELVEKVVAIEGLGFPDDVVREREKATAAERFRKWDETFRTMLAKAPRAYPSVEDVAGRIRKRNPFFTEEQALHLAFYTVKPNNDGTFALRDDPAIALPRPFDMKLEDRYAIQQAIACEVLLIAGADSWLPNSATDGREKQFRFARTVTFERAGHWAHHDRFPEFISEVRKFFAT
jgi:pimeloyl-ACP methyl ester carboxylesterase